MGWEGKEKNFLVLADSVKKNLFLCKYISLFSRQKLYFFDFDKKSLLLRFE